MELGESSRDEIRSAREGPLSSRLPNANYQKISFAKVDSSLPSVRKNGGGEKKSMPHLESHESQGRNAAALR